MTAPSNMMRLFCAYFRQQMQLIEDNKPSRIQAHVSNEASSDCSCDIMLF